ncbi:MAG: TolC family protein, partial [Bryobacterales bacterium]|nr:TolC family protein [Bryobacterales bacterium]
DLGAPLELASDFAVFEPGWDRRELIETAMSGHPGLRAALASEASASAQVNRARSSYFPRVSASAAWSGFTRQVGNQDYVVQQAQGSVDRRRRSCQFDNALLAHLPELPGLMVDDCSKYVLTEAMHEQVLAANQTFPFDFTRQPLSLRLAVSFPVFEGFTKQRNIAQAQADRRDATYARRAEELRLRAAVTQSYDDLATAYRALRIQERNLEVASEQLELASRRYALGAAPFLELLDAEDSLAQSERDHLAAVYDFHAA